MTTQFTFDFAPRPLLRLQEVERIIRASRILVPAPSRPTLIKLIEEGCLEGKRLSFGWAVYEDSFVKWTRCLQMAEELREAA